jgi:superfamily II DNA helicase RecQ
MFRGMQQPAIKAIMQQENPVVVIIGTGAGKSIAFMLLAACLTRVTIIVVLLVSLRGNLKD